MDKEKELAFNLFVRGFNYAMHYIGTQEISGCIHYPMMEEMKKQFNDNYLDVLLKELDEKEKQKKKDDINKIEERSDWCYIHNEKMDIDCYNKDGDNNAYYCSKCVKECSDNLTKFVKKELEIVFRKEKEEKRSGWCYVHNEEMDCYNEDGDHDDYHCQKCEIRMVKCVICRKSFELIQSHFWNVFYLCKKCEDKLEDSTECPNCKLHFSQLKKSENRNTSEFRNHMDNCRPISIERRNKKIET